MEENQRIRDFLSIFQGKSKSETCDLIKHFHWEDELIQEIIDVIEVDHASLIFDSICEALFNLYLSGQEEGIVFCFQFIPALIWAYYSLISKHVKWSSSKVEALILCFYNQIVQSNKETPFSDSYCIPTLAKTSIYHEPTSGVSSMLTEHTLSHHDKTYKPILIKGPTKFLDKIPAGYRSIVIKTALKLYNEFIPFYAVPSLKSFCHMVMRLSSCGFILDSKIIEFISTESLTALQNYPKVTLNADVMTEMVTSLHFISFNGSVDVAVAAMKCLHRKACYSICTAAVMMTDALQDIINLSTNNDARSNFEHSPPLSPYTCKYRAVNTDLLHKRRLLKQSQSTPRIPRLQDTLPRPSETSSPRSPEVFVSPRRSTSNDDVMDGFNFVQKSFGPVFLELGKKVALIDDNLFSSANTTETDVGETIDLSIGEHDLNGHDNNGQDIADTSFIELTMAPKETPKIIIDLSDFGDGRHSDEVPLMRSRLESYNSGEDSAHTSMSPLQSEHHDDVQSNGDVMHVYDTQL